MTAPFNKFLKPYFRQFYAGTITLETIWTTIKLWQWYVFLVVYYLCLLE
jgi:hypothetical protein